MTGKIFPILFSNWISDQRSCLSASLRNALRKTQNPHGWRHSTRRCGLIGRVGSCSELTVSRLRRVLLRIDDSGLSSDTAVANCIIPFSDYMYEAFGAIL